MLAYIMSNEFYLPHFAKAYISILYFRSLKEEILFLSIKTVNSDISTMSSLVYLVELLVRSGGEFMILNISFENDVTLKTICH